MYFPKRAWNGILLHFSSNRIKETIFFYGNIPHFILPTFHFTFHFTHISCYPHFILHFILPTFHFIHISFYPHFILPTFHFTLFGGIRVAHRFNFLCCPIMLRYVLCCDVCYEFRMKTMFG